MKKHPEGCFFHAPPYWGGIEISRRRFMKTTIFYDEMCVPEQIRIKSDRLCLDHTFSPNATLNCISYRDINSLLENPLFDTIQINLAKGTAYYEEYDGTLKPISSGWIQIKPSDIELNETNNLL